ncbi:MFS transporter [Nonomuraea monospora]
MKRSLHNSSATASDLPTPLPTSTNHTTERPPPPSPQPALPPTSSASLPPAPSASPLPAPSGSPLPTPSGSPLPTSSAPSLPTSSTPPSAPPLLQSSAPSLPASPTPPLPSSSAPPPPPLRRQRDYRLLWTARTISVTGSEVSKLAIPLTAVTLLTASPSQMGILTAAASVPVLLFGLQSGAIADRLTRHRPLMIACELVSCAAAATIPIAWLLGVLNVVWLIAVALVIGTAGVLFKAANFPHLAAVVDPSQRTEAMAGFHASYSVASVSGPGLAGLLVQLLTAPLAVLAEAFAFLTSALLLRTIRTPEHNTPTTSKSMWRDVVEGLRTSVTHPVLRALLGAGVTINFFAMAYTAVYMLYMLNTLGIPKALIGVLIALSGAGGLFGAWLTARLSKRYGEDRVLIVSVIFFPIEILTVGLLTGPLWWKLALLALTGTVTGGIVVAFATCLGAITLRETPPELRGRVNATTTFAVQGVLALGGLAGGFMAELIGLRQVILICAAGIALSTIWIWTSPLRPQRRRTTLPHTPAPSPTDSTTHLIETKRRASP